MKRKNNSWNNTIYMLSFVWKSHKVFILVTFFLGLLGCLEGVLPVVIVKMLIDNISADNAKISEFLILIAMFAGLLLTVGLINKWYYISFGPIQKQKIKMTSEYCCLTEQEKPNM